uniref:GST N-terminal domain-containing protein n=1 Tax=Globodera pallida TaxID=36090 RepID=A0A183CSJ8_GLOPA
MDPKNGLYAKDEDTVTFKAELITKHPFGMRGVRLEDALLVNGEVVCWLLIRNFSKLCFLEKTPKNRQKFKIDEVPEAVTNFERLIATLCPQNVEELD